MNDICKLCDKEAMLRNSHAIPNSIFQRLFKEGSGKAIILTSGDDVIDYSSDSLATHQLCDECEKLINEKYESYSINTFRNQYKTVTTTTNGITFKDVDTNKLCMFFIAIFWRAANSSHKTYSGAVMPMEFLQNNTNESIKKSILNNTAIPVKTISIKIQRLVDRSNRFNMQDLKELIVAPFYRSYGPRKKVSVCFVIEGFLITLIMPGLSFKERKSDNIVNRNDRNFVAGFVDIYSDEIISNVFLKSNVKVVTAKSRI